MILSFLAYIASLLVFGLSNRLGMLFVAMFCFSIGEAFRTGTHKAMIFDWLSRQDRGGEKTRVYGFTRSWSKTGSAVSVVLAAVLIFSTGRYSWLFLACIGPYLANIANFLTYPSYLDGPRRKSADAGEVVRTLLAALRQSVRAGPLRRLLAESMAFDGVYKVAKDYLQPVLKTTALALPVLLGLGHFRRTAVVVAAVYFVLFLLDGLASRRADALARRVGSEQRAARWLWAMGLAAYAGMAGGMAGGWMAPAIAGFVALSVIQNFWRPIQVSRLADRAPAAEMATVLSIESQARSLVAAVVAPVLGLAVDLMPPSMKFLPVGVLGAAVAAVMLAGSRKRHTERTVPSPETQPGGKSR